MSQPSKNVRRGVSLTELLLLMSACTMILSLCAVLLHRVMRAEIDARAYADSERNAIRLSHQFRNDVHEALDVQSDSSKLTNDQVLQVQLPRAQIAEYRFHEGTVLRTLSSKGKVEAREEFAFGPLCKLGVQRLSAPDRVVLTITSAGLDHAASQVEQLRAYRAVPLALQLEASIGRHAGTLAQSTANEQERAK